MVGGKITKTKQPPRTHLSAPTSGSAYALAVLKHAQDARRAQIQEEWGLTPPAREAVTRLEKAGDLLMRLVDIRESPHADLDLMHATRDALVVEFAVRKIDPGDLGLRDLRELVVVLEEWASSATARAAEYTSVELAHASRRETFLGHLVQHLLLHHRYIVPALREIAEGAASTVRRVAEQGIQPFLGGTGALVVPPKGQVRKPRRGKDVEFWDGEKWAAATDVIFSCEHIDGATGEVWGHHWVLEVEKKKAHVTTKQFRDRAGRLAGTPTVRWTDVETGLHVYQFPERILVNSEPVTRILMVGDLPARYSKEDYIAFARMRGPKGWQEYLRWDARLKLPVVSQVYDLVR